MPSATMVSGVADNQAIRNIAATSLIDEGYCVVRHSDGSAEREPINGTPAQRAATVKDYLSDKLEDGDRVKVPGGTYESAPWSLPTKQCEIDFSGVLWQPTLALYDEVLFVDSRISLIGLELFGRGLQIGGWVGGNKLGHGIKFGTNGSRAELFRCNLHDFAEFKTGASNALSHAIFINGAHEVRIDSTKVLNSGYYSVLINDADDVIIFNCDLRVNRIPSTGEGACGVSFGTQSNGAVYKSVNILDTKIEDEVGQLAAININAGINGSNTGYLQTSNFKRVIIQSKAAGDSSNRIKCTNVLRTNFEDYKDNIPDSPTPGSASSIRVGKEAEPYQLQRVTTDATSGDFTLGLGGELSDTILLTDGTAAVKAAIEAMPSITTVTVTGGAKDWFVKFDNPTFIGHEMKMDTSNLLGESYAYVQANPGPLSLNMQRCKTSSRINIPNCRNTVAIIDNSDIAVDNKDNGSGAINGTPRLLRLDGATTLHNCKTGAIVLSATTTSLNYEVELQLVNGRIFFDNPNPYNNAAAATVCPQMRSPGSVYVGQMEIKNLNPNANEGDWAWSEPLDANRKEGHNITFNTRGHKLAFWGYRTGGLLKFPTEDKYPVGAEMWDPAPGTGDPLFHINQDATVTGGKWVASSMVAAA